MEIKLVSFHEDYLSKGNTYISMAEYENGEWTGRSWKGELSNKKLIEILKPFLKEEIEKR